MFGLKSFFPSLDKRILEVIPLATSGSFRIDPLCSKLAYWLPKDFILNTISKVSFVSYDRIGMRMGMK